MLPLLSADPPNEPADLRVLTKLLDGVPVPSEILLADKPVDGAVAVSAQHGTHVHLLTRKPLLEPSVCVNGNGDEVMECQPSLSSA